MRILMLLSLVLFTTLNLNANVPIIPEPQEITYNSGQMTLDGSSKILYADPNLQVAAQTLADFIERVHFITIPTQAGSSASANDILLKFTSDYSITGEVYKLTIADSATIEGANTTAITYGCASLLQSIDNDSLDKLVIKDWPEVEYRGIMVDIARQWHSIEVIKQIIDLCHMYKIRYLQLHLCDDQSFTFPSTAYPALQGPGTRWYSLAEWKDMVAYAGNRNIILVPELEVPGHAARMCSAMPDLFGRISSSTIDFGNPTVWHATSNLILELCEVFTNSPIMHLGGDEVWLPTDFTNDATNQATIAQYDLGDIHGVFNFFFKQMDDVVKSQGKKTTVWEGFGTNHSKYRMPASISVMMFDNYKSATYYLNDGHDVYNASWFPLYVLGRTVPLNFVYDWDLYTFGNYTDPYPRRHTSVTQYTITPTPKVPGAQVCSWEQPETVEISSLRKITATFSERLWNADFVNTYTDHTNRLEKTDAMLQSMMATAVPDTVNPSASKDIYADKIVIRWVDGTGYPTGYSLYRNTVNNSGSAFEILSDSSLTEYIDTAVSDGQIYYYWLKASNNYGDSSFSSVTEGRRGNSVDLAYAYEGFDYPIGDSPLNKNGGSGWRNTWSVDDTSVSFVVKDDNLTYPGLKTSGKCIHMAPTGATSPERGSFFRNTIGDQGVAGSDLWVSFLFRPTKMGDGDFSFGIASGGGPIIKKRWGNGLYLSTGNYVPYALENNVTYFIVAKYECMNGNDKAYLWLNPTISSNAPSLIDPDLSYTEAADLGTGDILSFAMQRYTIEADIDEFRVGASWNDVIEIEYSTGIVVNSAYDGFDGVAGDSVLGEGSGQGWSGNWFDATGGLTADDVVFASQGLSYTDGALRSLITSGKALELTPQTMGSPTYFNVDRNLERMFGPDDTNVFVSLLVKPVTINSNLDYSFSLGDNLSLIVRGWKNVWVVNGEDSTIAKPTEGQTQFIVLKLDYSGANMAYDVWLNPSLDSAGTADFSSSDSDISFDSIRFAQQTPSGFSAQINQFDEIRVGTTYADVTPSIPEPALGILALIGTLFLRFFKK